VGQSDMRKIGYGARMNAHLCGKDRRQNDVCIPTGKKKPPSTRKSIGRHEHQPEGSRGEKGNVALATGQDRNSYNIPSAALGSETNSQNLNLQKEKGKEESV